MFGAGRGKSQGVKRPQWPHLAGLRLEPQPTVAEK